MGTSSARRGAVRQRSVGPHVAAGLTDRTGIVAASVPTDPAAEAEVPAAWRGWRASSAVLWAGAVMLLVLTLSSGFNEQPPPAKVASAQPPRPGSVKTLLPPAPAPVPRSAPSVGPAESHAATRDRAAESAPVAADPTTPPAAPAPDTAAPAPDTAAPAPDTAALARTAERTAGAVESLTEQALPAAEPSAVESRVEDQVADRVETVVEPMRRVVDTAFGMLLDITDQ